MADEAVCSVSTWVSRNLCAFSPFPLHTDDTAKTTRHLDVSTFLHFKMKELKGKSNAGVDEKLLSHQEP